MIRFNSAEELGSIIHAERKRRGYTQSMLADFSGVGLHLCPSLNAENPPPSWKKRYA